MPHMANLNWLMSFIFFNTTLIMLYCSLMPKMNKMSNNLAPLKNKNKKWQW